ncbi:DUF6057 family protein [Draconibacterium sp. IB214405]|uniref:DUF6057 family protein n=1 Tax=Draconibacterium sp. IB214405 TaxID=3097352 RepID=UPI002A157101|nr:DUF6057 family protein [Draconibacterium sp. IB214405]MDX8338052.1 DUF6057 family protein [Draconibacterium sp. IB214405]
MKRTETLQKILIPLAIAVVTFLYFQFFYSYHLFFKEQLQLFLFTHDYLLHYFQKPAALAHLSGDFLTQFFYLRGGGPMVLALVFALEWLLIQRTLKQTFSIKTAVWWALLPVAADFVSHLSLAYPLANSMGLILIISFFLLIERIKHKTLASTLIVILSIFGHYFFGSTAFVLPFLILFSKHFYKPVGTAALSLLLIVVTPYLFRANYLLPIDATYLFPATSWKGILLPAILIITVLISKMMAPIKRFQFGFATLALLFAVVLTFFGFRINANQNLEKILALDSETYFGNDTKVIELATKYKLENRFATYYTNMALAKTGQLSDRLLEFYQPSFYGLILPVSQNENWQTILFSNELFYLIGDMNLAQHSAMLGNTFSPYNRSSRMMKRLAEINMVNEDYEGAEKFLRMLEKTLFHKKWADKRLAENNATSHSQWLLEKRSQIAQTDTIRNGSEYLNALEYLVEQNSQNKIALDYLLCYHLLNKDMEAFKTAYDRFALPQFSSVPKVYSEALLIILFRENAAEETLQQYKIQPAQIRDFSNYTSRFEAVGGKGEDLKDSFGTSYWFYYHFATMQEE